MSEKEKSVLEMTDEEFYDFIDAVARGSGLPRRAMAGRVLRMSERRAFAFGSIVPDVPDALVVLADGSSVWLAANGNWTETEAPGA